MNDTKFTMNALVLVVTIFAAIGFFFTVKLGKLADHSVVNEYYPIEGTELGVRYGKDPVSGIYRGAEYSRDLKLAGEFGYDWGAAAAGDALWINEYTKTDLGVMQHGDPGRGYGAAGQEPRRGAGLPGRLPAAREQPGGQPALRPLQSHGPVDVHKGGPVGDLPSGRLGRSDLRGTGDGESALALVGRRGVGFL